jgi:hypothetical protein
MIHRGPTSSGFRVTNIRFKIAGAEFSDLLPESAWQPQRPIVVHDDGSASLAPTPAD